MKTEACKLCCRVLRIFLPNVIKIDPYNFELYRFKVLFCIFSETQCSIMQSHLVTLFLLASVRRHVSYLSLQHKMVVEYYLTTLAIQTVAF